MTFEERCERFIENSKKEHNRFKFVYRVIFLNKKIDENERKKYLFSKEELKERPKDHSKARHIIKKEQ